MVFMLIDAMANGAAREGFTWEQAIKFSAQAVKGSAEMVLRSGNIRQNFRIRYVHLAELRLKWSRDWNHSDLEML